MQGVQQRSSVQQGVWVEVHSRWSRSAADASIHSPLSGGIYLRERSRLLRIQGIDWLEPQHLETLFDPCAETATVRRPHRAEHSHYVDVFCLPGVTDAEGEMAALALHYAGLDGIVCRAGVRYHLDAPVPAHLRPSIERQLGNPLIQGFYWSSDGWMPDDDLCAAERSMDVRVATFDLDALDDSGLLQLSRDQHLALDAHEMRAIRDHFHGLDRGPTDVELQSLALTWSEHCSHKTFRAPIEFRHNGRKERIPGLLRTLIAQPTVSLNRRWVRSAFVDNAGVMAFDRQHDIAFKVETHNHPSALEPYGGAHTGVGGVIRDILAVSAEPVANTDVLCFGPIDLPEASVPAGVFHPERTRAGVVQGVADYGNNMGIPTVGGAVLYHQGYTANPLVFCGTLGIAPRGSHPRDACAGDLVVLLGGRTGRDGLHGATMSSEGLDRGTVAGTSVQIGAPITEKCVRDVLPHLRDAGLYHAITDCGAGGLCSAVGEMGETLGVDVRLEKVPLKYQDLQPWEIWLSEAQERMVLAVPEASWASLHEKCRLFDVEATVIGSFRGDGLLRLYYADRVVGELTMAFMHGGRPVRPLQAVWTDIARQPRSISHAPDRNAMLLRLLSHPNIASKESIIRRYDHEVGGATVGKPFAGHSGPADAAVLQPLPDSPRGVVLSHGINPLYGALDPHAMALLAVDEALRNAVAVGGSIDRTALLDNFCWGDVDDPRELGALVRAAQGCRDAALLYRTPFICGKDSLRNMSVNEHGRHSIPRTLLISAVGTVPDVCQTISMDLKSAGNLLLMLGTSADEMAGSHYTWLLEDGGGNVPCVRPQETPRLMRRLTRAIRLGLVRSCHDLCEGGFAVAAAEMALAGRLGLDLSLDAQPRSTDSIDALLFGESPGRFLVEVGSAHLDAVQALFGDLPHAAIGTVTEQAVLSVRLRETTVMHLSLAEIDIAWRGGVNA